MSAYLDHSLRNLQQLTTIVHVWFNSKECIPFYPKIKIWKVCVFVEEKNRPYFLSTLSGENDRMDALH